MIAPRVVVDLEMLRNLHCGLGQFSLHLGRALLAEQASDLALTYLLPKSAASLFVDSARDVMFTQRWRRESYHRRLRPLLLPLFRGRPVDVWHTTHQMSKYTPFNPSVPLVLTIHDLNYLREHTHERIAAEHRKLEAKIERAAVVTTISQFVADEVREHLNVRGKEIVVIHNGATAGQPTEAQRPKWLPQRPFLFTIGELQAKKNFHVLLDFVARLPQYSLVIAGNKNFAYAEDLAAQVREKGLGDRVFLPGMIADGERYWLYQHCEVFRSGRLRLSTAKTEAKLRSLPDEPKRSELLLRLQIPEGRSTLELLYEPLKK
jgi:glycosyltransferase involved in cell wall biosynthesis